MIIEGKMNAMLKKIYFTFKWLLALDLEALTLRGYVCKLVLVPLKKVYLMLEHHFKLYQIMNSHKDIVISTEIKNISRENYWLLYSSLFNITDMFF